MSLYPLGCLVELHLCFILLGLSSVDDCLQFITLSLLFKSLRPLFFDLFQLFIGVIELLLNDVLLFVVISHLIIVRLESLSVSFVGEVVLVSQLLLFSCMSAFGNLEVFG